MRNLLMFALILSMAGAAMAIDLGTQAPAKPADNSVYVAPEGAILQGRAFSDCWSSSWCFCR